MQFFIFCGTIAQIFGAKKDMASVPLLPFFGFYYKVPGKFLGCIICSRPVEFYNVAHNSWREAVKKFIYFNN